MICYFFDVFSKSYCYYLCILNTISLYIFIFVYKRGNLIIAVNPSEKEVTVPLNGAKTTDAIYKIGEASISESGDNITMEPQSFVIFK